MHPKYDRAHPFYATIRERYSLTKPGSLKDTQHVILDLAGSGIQYRVGDSIGVYPVNDPSVVEQALLAMNASGDEEVCTKKGDVLTFREFLSRQANLKGISRKMLLEIEQRVSEKNRPFLENLMKEENREALKQWMQEFELWDLLTKFSEAHFTPQEIAELTMPLLPRFYSIASSQAVVGDVVHLTVAYLSYETHGITRLGVCTHYLCHLAPLHQAVVPIYVQPSADFHLPDNPQTPLIMIGPGTGVAPYRAFLQEREKQGSKGKHWLFFGEWTREKEYYYQEDWERWVSQGMLKLDLAFSRDQPYKIYVQHKMLDAAEEFYHWIEDGAVIYVCGDAHHMAKDVDRTLHQIIQQQGRMNEEQATAYVKKLRKEKRYLRDVY
jgi:sulfite reductase (NADPH) flavoprotein alpha-component